LSAQESATAAVDVAGEHFPGVECKWGDSGLEDILQDGSIDAVAVVLAGQNQVSYFSSLLSYLPFLTLITCVCITIKVMIFHLTSNQIKL